MKPYKLAEYTESNDVSTHIYMRLVTSSGRVEEIDAYGGKNNEWHYHTSADNNPDLPKPEIREEIIAAFKALY